MRFFAFKFIEVSFNEAGALTPRKGALHRFDAPGQRVLQ